MVWFHFKLRLDRVERRAKKERKKTNKERRKKKNESGEVGVWVELSFKAV